MSIHRFGLVLALFVVCLGSRPAASQAAAQCSPFAPNGVQQCAVGISSSALDRSGVPADRQHESEWCWAATIAAMFAYYGHSVAQERIVTEAFGSLQNMPGQPSQVLSLLNRSWRDDRGRSFRVTGDSGSVNLATVTQDLASNHPVIVGSLGHATLLTEITYLHDVYGRVVVQNAEVRDPWPYSPERRSLSAQEWQSISFVARVRISDLSSSSGSDTPDAPYSGGAGRGAVSFDAGVDRLVQSATTKFRSVLGTRHPHDADIEATLYDLNFSISGLSNCSAWFNDDRSLGTYVTCDLYQGGDDDAAQAAYDRFVGQLKAYAQRNGGRTSESARDSGSAVANHIVETTYQASSGAEVRVEYRVSTSRTSGRVRRSVDLWVDAPS